MGGEVKQGDPRRRGEPGISRGLLPLSPSSVWFQLGVIGLALVLLVPETTLKVGEGEVRIRAGIGCCPGTCLAPELSSGGECDM